MSVAIANAHEARLEDALSLARAGRAAEMKRDLSQALARFDEARAVLKGVDPTPLLANLLRWIGSVHRDMGDVDHADLLYQESLDVAQQTGTTSGQAAALNCRAVIAQRRGDLDAAVLLYRRASRLAVEAGEIRLAGMIEQNLGVLANIRGDLDGALVRYRASLRAFEQVGDTEAVSWVLNNMGMLLNDLGQHARAERLFVDGIEIARRRDDRPMLGMLLTNFVEGLIAMKRFDEAADRIAEALAIVREGEDPSREAEALKFLAVLEREQGDYASAATHLGEALEIARRGDDPLLVAEILREWGDLRLRDGDADGAMSDWTEALRGFETLNATLDADGVRTKLARLPLGGGSHAPGEIDR